LEEAAEGGRHRHNKHWQNVSHHCGGLDFTPLWLATGADENDGRAFLALSALRQPPSILAYQAVFETWALLGNAALDSGGSLSDLGRIAGPQLAELVEPWGQRDLPQPRSSDDLLGSLLQAVNVPLASLGPRVDLLERHGNRESYWWQPVPRLTAGLCLQAFAFINDEMPARRCANEMCQQWFTRQRGRAEYGQFRSSGVLYCSASCAKAQAQRDYRRRHRRHS
jgi:hypothetical protein